MGSGDPSDDGAHIGAAYTRVKTESFELICGDAPLLISVPHSGSELPSEVASQLTEAGLKSADSDWFMRELYEPIARSLNGSIISPTYSRYAVDLNRPESDQSLYPGQRTTGLCPLIRFDGVALYPEGGAPDQRERTRRVERYWRPYHQALSAELDRLLARFGSVLLWEGHSIRSVVPMLFEGQLPDLNLGTYQGRSCAPQIERSVMSALTGDRAPYSYALNGRFKGGYITREYGSPSRGVHAVQLELSQRVYLTDERAPQWSAEVAKPVSLLIQRLISAGISALDS